MQLGLSYLYIKPSLMFVFSRNRPCRFLVISIALLFSGTLQRQEAKASIDYVSAAKDTLTQVGHRSDNKFLKLSCSSIIQVIESKTILSQSDTVFIEDLYHAFTADDTYGNPRRIESYLNRSRSFIFAWTSPTDGKTSYAWLKLPEGWEPGFSYPLYVQLHGHWSVAGDMINYLVYPYINGPSGTFAFEDGYQLSPWGRGNLWYRGIAETDILECISKFEEIATVEQERKYLCGHSMGGYGAWRMGQLYNTTWAALGIHAGALWYDSYNELESSVIERLKEIPVYFVCGNQDGLLSVNENAFNVLKKAGNDDLAFETFPGGHEYRQEDVENMYMWMRNFTLIDQVSDLSLSETSDNPVDINIFPNPCSSYLQFDYYLHLANSVQIEIYSLTGVLLKQFSFKEHQPGRHSLEWKIPPTLPAGNIICTIRTNFGTSSRTITVQ